MSDSDLTQWKMPDSYFGFNPVGDFGLYSRNRDSDTLTNSNWECLLKHFKELEKAFPFNPDPENNKKYGEDWNGDSTEPQEWVYVWSASHFAVGWVEYMMLREDAPKELREPIEEIIDDLKNCYPVFDDDHYSEKCWESKCEYWKNMSVKERLYYCQQAEISIFSARSEEMPSEVDQYIDD
jgi:hypothetical protein